MDLVHHVHQSQLGAFLVDNHVEKVIKNNINMVVPYYLLASYAYYEEDDPIISDMLFDSMAKLFLEHYDNITHKHKSYITKDMLTAGSFSGKYPTIVQDALKSLRKEMVCILLQ